MGRIYRVENMIPHEDDKPKDSDGKTVTIVDKTRTPNEEHLPNGKDDNNSIIEKEYLDAMGLYGDRKYDGLFIPTGKSYQPKGTPGFGEKVSEITGGGVKAGKAGNEALKEKVQVQDTVYKKAGEQYPLYGETGQWLRELSDTSAQVLNLH